VKAHASVDLGDESRRRRPRHGLIEIIFDIGHLGTRTSTSVLTPPIFDELASRARSSSARAPAKACVAVSRLRVKVSNVTCATTFFEKSSACRSASRRRQKCWRLPMRSDVGLRLLVALLRPSVLPALVRPLGNAGAQAKFSEIASCDDPYWCTHARGAQRT
jgi:hypothetical protein